MISGLSGRPAGDGGIESHNGFVARPQREHGRKYNFLQLLQKE
jgi:hypothetical protein